MDCRKFKKFLFVSPSSFRSQRAFTLIELLVVIAIIAILSIVVVLTLNPAQLLMQSRDSDRVSDMSTLNSALGIYSAQGGLSLGSSNVVYVSIPDPTATSSLGDQCQGLGLISLPTGYSYQCAASSTYRSTNGTGWIPVNFASMAAGSPLSILPIDPAQSSSSRLYYTYTTNGSQYELTSNMESAKYQLGGSNDVIGNDGGTLTSVYEKGSKLGLEPLDYGDTGLVGFWSFEEGSSSVAYDYSGNNATGSWSGTATGTFGYYSAGKIGPYAGMFDGSTNYINLGTTSTIPLTAGTISLWMKAMTWTNYMDLINFQTNSGLNNTNRIAIERNNGAGCAGVNVIDFSSSDSGGSSGANTTLCTVTSVATNTWYFVTTTWASGNKNVYINGVLENSASAQLTPSVIPTRNNIGGSPDWGRNFNGLIDDVRVYNRALTAAQIAAKYSGGK